MEDMRKQATKIINKLSDEDLAAFMPLLYDMDKKRREKFRHEFVSHLKELQSWAASVGYKESDIPEAIKSVRRRKHSV